MWKIACGNLASKRIESYERSPDRKWRPCENRPEIIANFQSVTWREDQKGKNDNPAVTHRVYWILTTNDCIITTCRQYHLFLVVPTWTPWKLKMAFERVSLPDETCHPSCASLTHIRGGFIPFSDIPKKSGQPPGGPRPRRLSFWIYRAALRSDIQMMLQDFRPLDSFILHICPLPVILKYRDMCHLTPQFCLLWMGFLVFVQSRILTIRKFIIPDKKRRPYRYDFIEISFTILNKYILSCKVVQ